MKVDNLDALISQLQDYCSSTITEDMLVKRTNVDTVVRENELDPTNFLMIDKLTPFGEGNREPVLLLQDAVIKHKQTIGKNGKSHLKLYTQCGNKIVEVIQWNQ